MICRSQEPPASVNVTLDYVAPQPCGRSHCAFKINWRSQEHFSQGRALHSLARDIRGEGIFVHTKRREADAINRNRIAIMRVLSNCLRLNYDLRIFTAPVDRAHASKFFNDAGEHVEIFDFRF